NRRITENPGTLRDLYYSRSWQVLEERVGSQVQIQQVWSSVYMDALVERDRDADGNAANGLEERLYAQQDANWHVTALLNPWGGLVERSARAPFGQVTYLTANWTAQSSSAYLMVYLHQGGRYASAIGLYSFRNRDYSPTLGRWIQQDPMGFGAAEDN